MSKNMNKLLTDPKKEVNKSANVLDVLLRTILTDLCVGIEQWKRLTDQYYKSRLVRTPRNAKDLSSDRNNFNRAIAKGAVTWNNFIRAVRILGAQRIDVSITLHWRNKKKTVHVLKVSNPVADIDDAIELDISNADPKVLKDDKDE